MSAVAFRAKEEGGWGRIRQVDTFGSEANRLLKGLLPGEPCVMNPLCSLHRCAKYPARAAATPAPLSPRDALPSCPRLLPGQREARQDNNPAAEPIRKSISPPPRTRPFATTRMDHLKRSSAEKESQRLRPQGASSPQPSSPAQYSRTAKTSRQARRAQRRQSPSTQRSKPKTEMQGPHRYGAL